MLSYTVVYRAVLKCSVSYYITQYNTILYCAVTHLMTNCWNAKAHPALLKSSGEAPFRNNTVAASGTTNTLNPVIRATDREK